ncbi:type I restriction-modification system subunit M [Loktanella sp. M215]|uniref:type I restriction-modification system subunit M n=1 Tax=Loktanella sp. M215 TaxID=2675431 RepID=UPI001F47D630|nr:N-6 DNA methylase [Loktanella sp. M215]
MSRDTLNNHAAFIWSIAELLRGDFRQSEYGKIVLPFTILRRLDCLLEATKQDVLDAAADLPEEMDDQMRMTILTDVAQAGGQIYNQSRFTFASLRQQDAEQLRANLVDYLTGFSPNVRDIFIEKFKFTEILKDLDDKGSLWMVFDRFSQLPIHPDEVSNLEMGYLFEELIRRFSEISNETAGEHFTPREVVHLLVDLLLANDDDALSGKSIIRRVYDPACGTGGMLSVAEEAMKAMNPGLNVDLFGQELNGESYAICKSDMLVKGHDASRIAFGNTLTQDAHPNETFHYMLSNPPYGVDWKKYADMIREEREDDGDEGRFVGGLPRISDGQFLFLQHMLSKMRDDGNGSRIGIVMNGSPLFTGGAGSGESEIRRWLMEDDLVEAIIALPTDIFYNTGIQTYIWILTNRKAVERRGKVQLIDASSARFWQAMRKSLGSKRRQIGEDARAEIVRIYGEYLNGDAGFGDVSKIFKTTDFGYREIRVERPLKIKVEVTLDKLNPLVTPLKEIHGAPTLYLKGVQDVLKAKTADQARFLLMWLTEKAGANEKSGTVWMSRDAFIEELEVAAKDDNEVTGKLPKPMVTAIVSYFGDSDQDAEVCLDAKGNVEADAKLRDHELVPLGEDWEAYIAREVTPFLPDAWVDTSHTDPRDGGPGRVGYEINFNRYFYQYVPPRPLAEIDAELKTLEAEIAGLLKEVVA